MSSPSIQSAIHLKTSTFLNLMHLLPISGFFRASAITLHLYVIYPKGISRLGKISVVLMSSWRWEEQETEGAKRSQILCLRWSKDEGWKERKQKRKGMVENSLKTTWTGLSIQPVSDKWKLPYSQPTAVTIHQRKNTTRYNVRAWIWLWGGDFSAHSTS